MSRFIQHRKLIVGLFKCRVVPVLVACAVLAIAAAPAKAADPVIQQVLGVDFDAVVNGKTNITARVGGDPDQVVFALSGPVSRTSIRTGPTYFFLSNVSGKPRYWNTGNSPEGAYTMNVRAIKDGRVADSVVINFTIDHDAVEQNSLARKTRLRTGTLAGGSNPVTPASASSSENTVTSDAKRSTQPVVNFASDAIDTFERGSNEEVVITINGDMAGNADILAIAWDHDRRQIVDAFAHNVDPSNPRITADKLELLPDGRMQIQLLYREQSTIQYKRLHDVTIVDPTDVEDITDNSTPVQTNPTKIVDVSGIESGVVLSGEVDVEAAVTGDDPDQVIFNVTGPEELTVIQKNAPFAFPADGVAWDTTKHANGQYSMTVSTLINGEQSDTRTINFTINNAVTVPDPVVAFPANAPATYRLGEGIDVPFTVDRELPENATVLVLAWSEATWGMVSEFAHYNDNGPWIIPAEKMALLQPGRAQLQLVYRADNQAVYKRTLDIEVLAAYSDQTDNGGAADSGSDSGNSGSVADDTTTNTDTSDNNDNSTADNSGSDAGSGNPGSGSSGGSDSGSADSGSGSDSTDTGDTTPPPSVTNTAQSSVLGMNLSFVTYWTREWVFVNLLDQSKGWTSTNTGGQPYDAGRSVSTDANGWPLLGNGQAAFVITMNGHDGHYPGGKYICTYEGEGDIVFEWDAKNGASQPGRIEVNVTPSNNGIYMRIENSNPGNHVRNVRLVHESLVDHDSAYHPLFVERLKPFKTLRFMDWQRTNTTHQRVWSDRITPSYHTQGERGGVSIERMIELCNELGADPWFCMPAQADDDYIRRFAQMVKARLHPDAKVYVEWSNEVWNGQFEVHKWIKEDTGSGSLSFPFFDKWAAEARRDFDIWSDVWSDQPDRLVRVAASQAANIWVTKQLAQRMNGKFDAISCSTYFGIPHPVEKTLTSSTTVDEIIDMLEENVVTDNRKFYNEHGDLCRQYTGELGRHIKLIAYEGGQHLADGGMNKPHKNALIAAQDHPKMYDLYQQNMLEFERAGGSANVMFNYVGRRDQWGSWGHLQYQDQPTEDSLKFKAMLDYPGSQKRLELTTFD